MLSLNLYLSHWLLYFNLFLPFTFASRFWFFLTFFSFCMSYSIACSMSDWRMSGWVSPSLPASFSSPFFPSLHVSSYLFSLPTTPAYPSTA